MSGTKSTPLEGYIMTPQPDWDQIASEVICGHPFIQEWSDDKMAEFQSFVREVIRTSRE